MKVCSKAGCPELTKGQWCDEHQPHGWHTSTRVKPAGWDRTRRRIMRRDRGRCVICGRRATVVDHLIPQAWGGDEEDANLRALCRHCHDAKTIEERLLGKKLTGMTQEQRAEEVRFFALSWRA